MNDRIGSLVAMEMWSNDSASTYSTVGVDLSPNACKHAGTNSFTRNATTQQLECLCVP